MWDTKENWMGQQGLHPGANPPAGFRWSEYQQGQEAARQAREAEDRRRNAAWSTPMNYDAPDTTSRPLSSSSGGAVIDTPSDLQNWLIVILLMSILALPVIIDVIAFLNR